MRIYSQENWKIITGNDGKRLVEKFMKETVMYCTSCSVDPRHWRTLGRGDREETAPPPIISETQATDCIKNFKELRFPATKGGHMPPPPPPPNISRSVNHWTGLRHSTLSWMFVVQLQYNNRLWFHIRSTVKLF